jgi:aspartate racemase
LLATQATIEHRLYQHAFSSSPFEIVTPSVEEQKVVDRSISCIKAGYVSTNPHLQDLIRIIERYQDTEVSIVLGGCSEIPLLFPYFNLEIAMLDPTMMLAMMAIQKAS